MTPTETPNLADIFKDSAKVQKALTEAVYNAARVHKMMGVPMVTWRDGKVHIVQPEDVDVPPSDEPVKLPMF